MSILLWLLYFGLTAGLIAVDRKRERAKAREHGTVDFADRRILPYVLLGAIFGPLPLLVYFGTTRKTKQGWLLGVGAVLAVYAALVVVAVIGHALGVH